MYVIANNDIITWDKVFKYAHIKKAFDEYNTSIYGALREVQQLSQDIKGRDEEIEQLFAILERPVTPVALLLGQAGVGKTALVQEFVKQLNTGTYKGINKLNYKYLVINLNLGLVGALPHGRKVNAISNLLKTLADLEKVIQNTFRDPSIKLVLFMDEIHNIISIFGEGTKTGGDLMKEPLNAPPIRIIMATTRREYDQYIYVDKPFSERLKTIQMNELPKRIIKEICYNWWMKRAPDFPPPTDEQINMILRTNAMYRTDSAEPRRTMDVLEDLVSHVTRTHLPITKDVLTNIFMVRYSIQTDSQVKAEHLYSEVSSVIKGQPYALYQLKKAFRRMEYNTDVGSNRPIFTALFTGPTGVGKTETTKCIAKALYPDDDNILLNINMPDYKTDADIPKFKKDIADKVAHNKNAIILLDELEKAYRGVLDALLKILDEGMISKESTDAVGHDNKDEISLRNTIIIGTTNAGHEIFKNDAQFSQRKSSEFDPKDPVVKSEMNQLMVSLRTHLEGIGLRPEFLNRFQQIIPYKALDSTSLMTITERKLDSMIQTYKDVYDIDVVFDPPRQWGRHVKDAYCTDVVAYITFSKLKDNDPNTGGARAVDRELRTQVEDVLLEAIFENEGCHKFKLNVTEDNYIYKFGLDKSGGEVVASAIKT